MLFENRLLFTGKTKKEAYDNAKYTLDTIEAKLSLWKNRPVKFCDIEKMNPTVIDGTTYYYNIVKPHDKWCEKCDFTKISYDKEWKKRSDPIGKNKKHI